jgi:hypothetical protein
MEPGFIEQLRFRAYPICSQWETLLRLERPDSPLANPDALRYLIPETFNEVLEALERIGLEPERSDSVPAVPPCGCGKNPYRAYYQAAERALLEATVLIQAQSGRKPRYPGEIASVMCAVRTLAKRDIEGFCGICSYRGELDDCRFCCRDRALARPQNGSAGLGAA